jgi:hypothetical protein
MRHTMHEHLSYFEISRLNFNQSDLLFTHCEPNKVGLSDSGICHCRQLLGDSSPEEI